MVYSIKPWQPLFQAECKEAAAGSTPSAQGKPTEQRQQNQQPVRQVILLAGQSAEEV